MTGRVAPRAIFAATVLSIGLLGAGMRSKGLQATSVARGDPDDSQPVGRESQIWTTYRNRRWGFCVSYPSNWRLEEGFDGAGMSASPPQERSTLKRSVVSAGALRNQLEGLTSGAPRTLEQNFEIDLKGLNQSRVDHLEVLQERRAKFRDVSALLTTIRWTDLLDRVTWVEATFWVIKDGVVYTIGLKCPQDDVHRMMAVHKKMTQTFALHCHAALDPAGADSTEHATE